MNIQVFISVVNQTGIRLILGRERYIDERVDENRTRGLYAAQNPARQRLHGTEELSYTGSTLILGCPYLCFLWVFRSIRPQILSPEVAPFKGCRSVGESLRQIHRQMPNKELTPQIEQEIVEAVQAYRAGRRG